MTFRGAKLVMQIKIAQANSKDPRYCVSDWDVDEGGRMVNDVTRRREEPGNLTNVLLHMFLIGVLYDGRGAAFNGGCFDTTDSRKHIY